MFRVMKLTLLAGLLCVPALASAAIAPQAAQSLYDRVTPSLVAVQYVFQNELVRRELIGPGIIVGEDGLVMSPISMFPIQIPDKQMTEFKILVPREDGDPQELEAVFQGRDERTEMAFLKTKEPQHWKALRFEDQMLKIGEPVTSVGMLPKNANYKPYFMEGAVAAHLRGELPQVLVSGGGLASVGSPVFDGEGKAIGIVSGLGSRGPLLNMEAGGQPGQELASIIFPPRFFTPASDFLLSLKDPPTPEHPVVLPWMGVSAMNGVSKDLAEAMGLGNEPAIQVGDVIADTPAEKAGLKSGDFIVKLNGKPLERGDEPSELPSILTRRLARLKPGVKVTLSVLREKDQPLKQIEITLATQPKRANLAERYYAEDLGFVVRELVFSDKYTMKLPSDQKGVLVALLKPQAAAQNGGLHMNDVITRLDNEPVTDVDQFKKSYEQLRKDKPTQAIVMEVRRGDREDTVRIEPPR